MLRRGGIRARLALTLVAMVALTAILLGAGAYVFVETSLHDQVLRDAAAQARFDLSVTVPNRGLPADPTAEDIVDSGLRETFLQRGIDTIADVGSGEPVVSNPDLVGELANLPDDFTKRVADGELAYTWTTVADHPSLVIGGRVGGAGPAFYFIHDISAIDEALGQFRLALTVGTVALILLALLVAQAVARGVLAPVEAASRAAERLEHGDLSARVPVTSDDEFGTWADRFNRMAEALAETIGRLEAAEAQNRRFVADVAHELRTPLAALVAEASILREHLDSLPDASRRAGELLVSDVGRLRSLVDDLMEVSRFDAHAEQIAVEPVDLTRLVRAITTSHLPEATLALPDQPLVIETEPRRLDRILANLLDNAREHAPGAPVTVSLGTDAPAAEIVVAVTDRGPGVPRDRLARIFERFYKADPSRHGGSSGLGLAIAAEHAALLGGYLTASDLVEGGLRMELRLPVTGSLPRGDGMAIGGVDAVPAHIRAPGVRTMIPVHRSGTLLALVAVIALVAACSGGTGGLGSVPTSEPTASAEPTSPDLTPGPSGSTSPSTEPSIEPSASPDVTTAPSASPSSTDTMIVRNYFVLGVEPGSAGLVPVLREVPKTTAVATTAMRSLLAGPAPIQGESTGPSTAIPEGTRLLGLTAKSGIATVNLSTEFDSGSGQESMQYRLAQVVYTLTQFSTIKSVVFQIDGVTVTVFGSEGIVLDGPVGRADYSAQLPAIFVDRPAYGAAFKSGDRVAGNADVFEATFRVRVVDAGGKTLADQQVMASCGSGCRGTFSTTVDYVVGKGQWGTLRAYDLSAKDGTPENVREYPVWLTPGG